MRKTLFICGLESEARILRPLLSESGSVIRVAPKAETLAAFAGDAEYEQVISFGIAGGLAGSLKPGDIVLADRLVSGEREFRETDPELRRKLAAAIGSGPGRITPGTGAIYSDGKIYSTPEHKLALAAKFNALAVDAESHLAAGLAQREGKPLLVVRAICDTAGDGIPPSAIEAIDEFGHVRPARFCRHILKRPGDLPGTIRLGVQSRRAHATLKAVASLFGGFQNF